MLCFLCKRTGLRREKGRGKSEEEENDLRFFLKARQRPFKKFKEKRGSSFKPKCGGPDGSPGSDG